MRRTQEETSNTQSLLKNSYGNLLLSRCTHRNKQTNTDIERKTERVKIELYYDTINVSLLNTIV